MKRGSSGYEGKLSQWFISRELNVKEDPPLTQMEIPYNERQV